MAAVDRNLQAIRNAVAQAKAIAEVFHTAIAHFYDPNSDTPTQELFHCTVRVKKPRPSAFDAGNEVVVNTKRRIVLKLPMDIPELEALGGAILYGWVVQIEPADPDNPDGDPTIYNVSFTVQSAITSQFAAEREVAVETEVQPTPRAN